MDGWMRCHWSRPPSPGERIRYVTSWCDDTGTIVRIRTEWGDDIALVADSGMRHLLPVSAYYDLGDDHGVFRPMPQGARHKPTTPMVGGVQGSLF